MEQFTPHIFTSVINSYLPEPQASLLNGMLFGINLKTSKLFYDQLKIVGLLHIVVLSGMNITLIGSMLLNLFTSLGKRLSLMLTILIIILFVLFVGFQAPIVRAGFMGILTLVSFISGRKNSVYFALFASILVIAVCWPHWLTTVSLQLSYGATLGIIFFGKTTEAKSTKFWDRFITACKNNLKVSLAAQVFTVPIIFLYFKQLSIIAPVSNLFVSFFIGPLTFLGFITAILGKINYSLGLIPAYLCYGILSYMIFIIETLSKLPYIYFQF